jgi:hypothetical protein
MSVLGPLRPPLTSASNDAFGENPSSLSIKPSARSNQPPNRGVSIRRNDPEVRQGHCPKA